MILRLAQGGLRLGLRLVYLRYILASVGALAIDMGMFLLLMRGGMAPMPASLIGYSAGIAVHWLLSSRAVFTDAKGRDDGHRRKILFLLSALLGLGLTALIVGGFEQAGIDPRIGKIVAVAVSFQAVWLLRRHIVFTP